MNGTIKVSKFTVESVMTGIALLGRNDVPGDHLYDVDNLVEYIGKNIELSRLTISEGTTPSVSAQPGAGTSANANIVGNDTLSTIVLTIGTPPLGVSAAMARVTYTTPLSGVPKGYILQEISDTAIDLSGTKKIRVKNLTVNGYDLYSGSTALDASTAYTVSVLIIT